MLLRGATKLAALGVWLLVGLSAVFWGLKLIVRPAPLPAQAGTVSATQALRGDLTRLLGTAMEPEEDAPAPVAAASRFRLVGVVAPRSPKASGEGVALIAIDGKPARAYRVGAQVDGDLVLQAVRARGADLGARGTQTAAVALDIAPLPPAATGAPAGMGSPTQLPRPAGAGPRAPGLAPPLRSEADLSSEADDGTPEPPPPTAGPPRPGLATQ